MAKKRFTNSFEDIFTSQPESTKANRGKTKEANLNRKVRYTYMFDEQTIDTIRAISYYRRLPISDVLNEACKAFISSYKDLDKAVELYTNHQPGK